MYFKDFSSGAMIENIVRRAKKLAIKRRIASGAEGHPHRRPASRRSTRSTRSTRTCPTRPTRTTGRRSRARRASGSSTSARSSSSRRTREPERRPVDRAGRRPASTSDVRRAGDRCTLGPVRVRVVADPQGVRHRDRVRHRAPRAGRVEPGHRVVAADQRLRQRPGAVGHRRAEGRLGLRGRDARQRRPGLAAAAGMRRPRSRPTSSTRCSPTAPATTSTTPTPSCPRPSAPTPGRSWSWDRAAEQILDPVDGGGQPPAARRARRSSSTRTTPTARATPTAATRTTSWTGRCRSVASSPTPPPTS